MNNQDINEEINSHLNNPQNYGQIYPSNGVGMGFNPQNREFVIFYLYIQDDKLKNVGYGVSADDNAIVLASMFSQMIKGDTVENAKQTLADMREEISQSLKAEKDSANIVLTSFESALKNYKNLQDGLTEAMHKLQIS